MEWIKFTKSEIKALIIACRELNEKLPFVVTDYYEDFDLDFKSNDELDEEFAKAFEKLEERLRH